LSVLDRAKTRAEALQAEELPYNVVLTNNTDGLDGNDRQVAWHELERTLG
jgi:hypothetical protein